MNSRLKAASFLLGFGVLFLIIYLLLVFRAENTNLSAWMMILLVLSVGLNAAGVNVIWNGKVKSGKKDMHD